MILSFLIPISISVKHFLAPVSDWGFPGGVGGFARVNRDSSQTGRTEDALYAVTAALRQVIAKLTKNFEITRRLACR